ncbi:MAG: hypothetical protein HY710_15085 [Candidatus Latescibacteria bacterium]|nr:hypothetical protein [Candidatus Latescibacterota bacterium]
MRRDGYITLVAAVLVMTVMAAGSLLRAAEETKTIEGELVDARCYALDKANRGGDHKECATRCATAGTPVGVLDEKTGTVYVFLSMSKGYSAHVGKTVRVTGTVVHASQILPDKLEVKEGNAWKQVETAKDMM